MGTQVGIREFREQLSRYTTGDTPVAVTRHGNIVGYFIPTPVVKPSEVESLRQAAGKLDDLLQENGVDIEDLMDDYKRSRKH